MKMKNFIKYIGGIVLLLTFSISCTEDFLNRPPEDALTIDNFYQTPDQVNSASAALYGFPWFELNDKAFWTIGDAGGGNHWTNDGDMAQFMLFTVTQNSPRLNEAWNSLYRVVAHANSVINNVPSQAGESVPEDLKNRVVAEAIFMRATAYFYLVRLWGAVPIIENNSDILFDPVIPKNLEEDVYQFIINDLNFAIDNLDDSYTGSNIGRVTSWAAKGMLAKVYLAKSGLGQSGSRDQADLDMSKQLAGDVMNNSGLALQADYNSLFTYAGENGSETLFALQWIACQDWGTQNTYQAYWAKNNEITGTGDGWGGYIGPTIDLQNAYEEGDLRRKATIMLDGDHYPELMSASGGYTYVQQPGDDIGENACHSAIKKYVIGRPDDNDGRVCFMSTGVNTHILRLADVYLIYAEAVLGNQQNTSDAAALAAFNAVRNRAGLDPMSSITLDDVYHERRVEFAYEGDLWYDYVRLHYWNPQKAITMIADQERGTYTWEEDIKVIDSKKYTPTDEDFTLPIPASESDKNPKLLEEPVPYEFN